MTEQAPIEARAVAMDDGPSPIRELAQRLSGNLEVLLLWHSDLDCVEVSVRDPATGAGFDIPVAPGRALDAFYHPYAYAARRDSSSDAERAAVAGGAFSILRRNWGMTSLG
jgi:hypothetical protein